MKFLEFVVAFVLLPFNAIGATAHIIWIAIHAGWEDGENFMGWVFKERKTQPK